MAMSPAMLIEAAVERLYSHGDYEGGLELIERALEIITEEDDFVEALMLKAEAEYSLGDRDAALRATLVELEGCMLEPLELVRVGEMYLELGDEERAGQTFHQVLADDDSIGDAHRGLGVIAWGRDDAAAAIRHSLDARRCYRAEPRPDWAIAPDHFTNLAARAIAKLGPAARSLLEDVPLAVADSPSEEMVREGHDPRALCLIRTTGGDDPEIAGVTLYYRNIERISESPAELQSSIALALEQGLLGSFELELDD